MRSNSKRFISLVVLFICVSVYISLEISFGKGSAFNPNVGNTKHLTPADFGEKAGRAAATTNATHGNDMPARHKMLLNQPYYVYEELVCPKSSIVMFNKTMDEVLKDPHYRKHSDDWWFMQAALNQHPMRTQNPKEGKLFVVPSLINMASYRNGSDEKVFCCDNVCGDDLIAQTGRFLSQSKWFQRSQGRDHVLVASHYRQRFKQGGGNVYMGQCHIIGFENIKWNAPDRYTVPSYYVGNPCIPTEHKPDDFALIASLGTSTSRRFRRNICQWMQKSNYSMPVCGSGSQCPALAQAKFGFHVRGDTYGASRLMDTILSGTVPVFAQRGQYDVLPDWIDWDQISYFVDVTNESAFRQDIHEIVANDKIYREKRRNVLANRDLFDWTTPVPFDTYMYMILSQIHPELTNATSSPYSALKFPNLSQPFSVFQRKSKVICGRNVHFADSCAKCPADKCRGEMCKACPNGPKIESHKDRMFASWHVLSTTDQCVTHHLEC